MFVHRSSLRTLVTPLGLAGAMVLVIGGCTPAAAPLTAAHPASPEAEPGRLVGAPSALAPAGAETSSTSPTPMPAATPTHDHDHHDHHP